MRLFDTAAEEYDAARPNYPPQLYDVIESETGSLSGQFVADGGAGTGIVSRQLLERSATVVAIDPGVAVLGRARARTPDLPAVVADAAATPLRAASLDLMCFGQSWHWVDQERGAQEAGRVLRPGGWWAAWWNHPWADEEEWFDSYYSLIESRCPGTSRQQRDVDWCAQALAASDGFGEPLRHVLPWERTVAVEEWIVDLRSHSYVIDLDPEPQAELLSEVETILHQAFPEGIMTVAYKTRLWMARRSSHEG
jgi:SAM-dependent methyltransferase